MKLVRDMRGHMHVKNLSRKAKIFTGVALAMVMSVMTFGVAFASGTTTTDFTAIQTALTSKFTVAEIAALIGIILASGIGFVLLWWGSRKLIKAIVGAFKTGKIRF